MKLSVKQKKFADEYIISGNATQSAIKAGYAKKAACQTGAENLRKPYIRAYIDERLKTLDEKAVAKQEEVLMYLTAVMRGEHTEQTLKGEGEGFQSIVNIDVSAKDRIKAAELLGKRYGTWTEKIDLTGEVNIVIGDYNDED